MIPKPLLDDIATGKCLPFIGAGFSLNAKLPLGTLMPDWSALSIHLAELANISPEIGNPKVASEYEKRFGRVQLIETIRDSLHLGIAEPSAAHVVFAQLPFETIYTTNFDLLLEEGNVQIKKPYRSLVGELQMPFHGGPLTSNIVKMHGDLRHEEHMIITQEDYDKYLLEYPVISTHLSAMLITRTALFVGYSLTDPDFQHIRQIIRSRLGRFARMSYIVQFNQPSSKKDELLEDNLHLINLEENTGQNRAALLEDLFKEIQKELDIRAGKQLRTSRPDIFEPIQQDILDASSRAPDSIALLSSSSNLCFVLMPFGDPYDHLYRAVIKPLIMETGLTSLRADEIFSIGSVMEQIRSAIQQARMCIADLTGKNPNVLFELGIAQTLGKPTIIMTQDINDIPFDIRHQRVIVYDSAAVEDTKLALERVIQNVLGHDRIDEASNLIKSGMLRAGVAILGVLLEHGLKSVVLKRNMLNCDKMRGTSQFSIGKLIQVLHDAEILSDQEMQALRKCLEIRNKAVHDLAEPSSKDAFYMMKHVESFIRRYIGYGFAEQNHPADPE